MSFSFGDRIFLIKNKPYINDEIAELKNKAQKNERLSKQEHIISLLCLY